VAASEGLGGAYPHVEWDARDRFVLAERQSDQIHFRNGILVKVSAQQLLLH
jgi:hypothetical protein